MSLTELVTRRVVAPAVVRLGQWRGDPVARLMRSDTRDNPYPLYAELRGRGLVYGRQLGNWMTVDHATVTAVLRDPRFGASPTHQRGYRPPVYPAGDPRADLPPANLLELDPPDHTRLRGLVSGTFAARAVTDLEPFVRDTAARLLDQVDPTSGFDLIEALAFPLPMAVICRLLGVPAEDQTRFRAWGRAVASTLDPGAAGTAEGRTRAAELALTAYLRDLVARRRADPDDSLLSALVMAEEEGDRLSTGEVISMALLILVAGFETTVNLIGNGTSALLSAPEQWRRLGEEPGVVPRAVEELLRYDSPVQLTSRIATQDVEVGGSVVRRGAPVIVVIGGANRDPEVFDQPDEVRVDRPNASRHLSFSFGIHHCVGAALARLEGRVAFEELTRRLPGLALAGRPARRPLLVLRGFETIPVRAG
jgi:cytochrome P450